MRQLAMVVAVLASLSVGVDKAWSGNHADQVVVWVKSLYGWTPVADWDIAHAASKKRLDVTVGSTYKLEMTHPGGDGRRYHQNYFNWATRLLKELGVNPSVTGTFGGFNDVDG